MRAEGSQLRAIQVEGGEVERDNLVVHPNSIHKINASLTKELVRENR